MSVCALARPGSLVVVRLLLRAFPRKPQCLEPLSVGMERLLRSLVLAHGLFGVGAARGITFPALFGRERLGGGDREIFCHGGTTRAAQKGSTRFRAGTTPLFPSASAIPYGTTGRTRSTATSTARTA